MLNNNAKLNDEALDAVSGGKSDESFGSCPEGCIEVKDHTWKREGHKDKCDCGSKDLEEGRYWFMETGEVADGQRCRKCGAAWI